MSSSLPTGARNWLRPRGKYLIQVCRSLSCEICDSSALTSHCKKKFGIDVGETTPDGRFTLKTVECLASCGTAPAMQVNRTYHEQLDEAKLDQILESLP